MLFFPPPSQPSPGREFVIPYKLPPDSSPDPDESADSLWFDEMLLRTTPNRFGTSTSSSTSSSSGNSNSASGPSRSKNSKPGVPSSSKTHYDSGNFRSKEAPIWDPHPQYKFTAFGRLFHLILSPAEDFVSPTLRVTTHESNYTWRDEPGVSNKCFYRGHLAGDGLSSVAVSLCHGMVSSDFIPCDAEYRNSSTVFYSLRTVILEYVLSRVTRKGIPT